MNNLHKTWKSEIYQIIWDPSQGYSISKQFLGRVDWSVRIPASGAKSFRNAIVLSCHLSWVDFSVMQLPVSHSCTCKWLLYYIPVNNSNKILHPSSLMSVELFLWSVISDLCGTKRYLFLLLQEKKIKQHS